MSGFRRVGSWFGDKIEFLISVFNVWSNTHPATWMFSDCTFSSWLTVVNCIAPDINVDMCRRSGSLEKM